jgi:hypothetical protein
VEDQRSYKKRRQEVEVEEEEEESSEKKRTMFFSEKFLDQRFLFQIVPWKLDQPFNSLFIRYYFKRCQQ